MTAQEPPRQPDAARVDYRVEEEVTRVDGPDDEALRVTTEVEQTVGAAGPSNWWRLGLLGLGIVVAILLVLQLFGGKTGTDVIPGTPTQATSPVN